MNSRIEFQNRRLTLLSASISLEASLGLEIGACDLPTVPKNVGVCRYADFRSADEMVRMWGLPADEVCHVDYKLSRGSRISEQITESFDYVIACHVLEHVPDIIGYINDLRALLKDETDKIIFITLPDKRATLDATRPSTTVERLLAYHHGGVRSPTFENIIEFHRHWVGYANHSKPLPLRESYEYARQAIQCPSVDAHCHVWTDMEFREQVTDLINEGFLPGLYLRGFEPFFIGTNEFAVVLGTK